MNNKIELIPLDRLMEDYKRAILLLHWVAMRLSGGNPVRPKEILNEQIVEFLSQNNKEEIL